VRENDVALQERTLRRRDARVGEESKAGVDAIRRSLGCREALGEEMCGAHGAERLGGNADRHRPLVHAPQLREAQRPRAELQDV